MSIDNLDFNQGVDYSKLQTLLREGRWKEADYETYIVMLKVVGRKEGDWIRPKEMKSFPSNDLLIINSLWTKYSNGKFGFSTQKQIYERVRSSLKAIDAYQHTELPATQQEKFFPNESV